MRPWILISMSCSPDDPTNPSNSLESLLRIMEEPATEEDWARAESDVNMGLDTISGFRDARRVLRLNNRVWGFSRSDGRFGICESSPKSRRILERHKGEECGYLECIQLMIVDKEEAHLILNELLGFIGPLESLGSIEDDR